MIRNGMVGVAPVGIDQATRLPSRTRYARRLSAIHASVSLTRTKPAASSRVAAVAHARNGEGDASMNVMRSRAASRSGMLGDAYFRVQPRCHPDERHRAAARLL